MLRSVAATFLSLAVLAPPALAQTVRYGVMADSVRALLAGAWSDDPGQLERAYCVRRARIREERISPIAVDTIFRIVAIRPADVSEAGPNHARFECPPGTPELHTHSPATCLTDEPEWCVTDGPLAYSCQPSRGDYEKLARRGDAFGIIQCDRKTFRFYYRSEFGPVESFPRH